MFLVRQGGRVDYNYKEYYLDSINELPFIPVEDCSPGSVAYIIDKAEVYMLNSKKEWIKQ